MEIVSMEMMVMGKKFEFQILRKGLKKMKVIKQRQLHQMNWGKGKGFKSVRMEAMMMKILGPQSLIMKHKINSHNLIRKDI